MIIIYKIIIIYLYLFIIFFSSIGYGIFFKKLIFNTKENSNIFELFLLSIPLLTFIGIFIHFFNKIDFLIVILINGIGFIFFLIYFKKISFDNTLKILFFTKIFLFSFLFGNSLHEDFYYHQLPYLNLINSYKIIFGLVNFNDVLANPYMSWFNYSVLFALPPYKFELNFILNYLLFFCFVAYLILEILNSKLFKVKFLTLIILAISLVVFSKLKDHGTDVPPQIFIILGFINLLKYKYEKGSNIYLSYSILFFTTAIILRINSIFILPLLFYCVFLLIKRNKLVINNIKFIIFILILSLTFFSKNFINTGCFFYPVHFTCIENISWGIESEVTSKRMNLLEASSKGYMFYSKAVNPTTNKFVWSEAKNILSHKDYLKSDVSFWIKYWLMDHDINRLLNIPITILILILIILISIKFRFKKETPIMKIENFLIFLVFLSILFWFLKTPQTRFAGYSLFSIFFSLVSLNIITRFYFETFFINKKILMLFLFFIFSCNFFYNIPNTVKNLDEFDSSLNEIKNFDKLIIEEDYYEKIIDGILIKLRTASPKLYVGNILEENNYILFCGNIDPLCIPEKKIACFKKIQKKLNYIFIYPDKYGCLNLLKKNIIY